MARSLRNIAPFCFHHVCNRGVRKRTIFLKDGDYKAFIKVLADAGEKTGIRVIAFCLMPNHFHIVMQPTADVSVSTYIHWVTSTHVRRYHKHYDQVGFGHLYKDRFRNTICAEARNLLSVIRYVEANPLKAGLVKSAADWRWSSLWLREHGDPDGLLLDCPFPLPFNWVQYIDTTTVVDGGLVVRRKRYQERQKRKVELRKKA